MQLLTHSRASCFRACPRKHHLRYDIGLRREETGFAARVGSAFHKAVETHYKGADITAAIEAIVEDPYDMALVAAMYEGWSRRWEGDHLELVGAEIPFEIPLRNPETGAPSTVWRQAGVIDRIVKLPDGRLALQELKTTSQDFSPGSDYWMKLHLDQQLSIYTIAARSIGFDVSTIIYDVTRRPALRPKKATPLESRKYRRPKKGEEGLAADDPKLLYANQRLEDETPEEFCRRVAQHIEASKDEYFVRMEIARLDRDLEECAAELWQQQKAIRAAQRLGYAYRNPGACFTPFRCDYVDVCHRDDLDEEVPAGFVRLDDVHPELAEKTIDS